MSPREGVSSGDGERRHEEQAADPAKGRQRSWTPYDDPLWVTAPFVCLISDDGEYFLTGGPGADDPWVVAKRNPALVTDPLDESQYVYFAVAETKEEALALVPPP